MDHDASIVTAVVPAVFLPKPGVALWLSIRRDRCFVFGPDAAGSGDQALRSASV